MANGSAMVEGDEIELSLGLSIGGSYRKSEKSKQVDEKSTSFPEKIDSKPTSFDTDVRQNYQSFSRSSASPPVQALMDPQAKRVIHALRRQEVRKKREEKQMKKGVTCKERNGGYMNGGFENKLCLEAQQFQTRVRDREIKENEAANIEERTRKSNKNGCVVNGELKNVNLSLNHNPTLSLPASPPTPVVPMQYAYPHLQYVPLTNGFAFPYVMPCWAPSAATVNGTENNFFHPVACRSFRPYQVLQSSNCNSGENSSKDGGNGSPVCSSSAVSDYRTTSWEGDSCSYTGSRSSNSQPQPPQQNALPTSDTRGQSEYSASSQRIESTQGIDKATNYTEKVVSLNIAQSSPLKPKEGTISETRLGPVNKPISTAENPNPGPLKEAKGDMNKPPRPQTQGHDTPPLSQMPCVSTTGNGPNGKNITGFLYRYTKTEVSIVCVCHGSSFSPAEFVEHAGGTDVSHPLRHITVVPSAFG